MMTEAEKDVVIGRLLESDDIKLLYDVYIRKDISFEDWVVNTAEAMLNPKPPPDADELLKEIMSDD